METYGLEKLGIINAKAVYRNLTVAELTERALARGEGKLSNTGALVVKTGKYTGRSAKDKFIVDTPAVHDEIAWGSVNMPISREKYEAIKAKAKHVQMPRGITLRDLLLHLDLRHVFKGLVIKPNNLFSSLREERKLS